MTITLIVVGYFILGYLWTLFFKNVILEDGVWGDTGQFGLGSALLVTLAWPAMVILMVVLLAVAYFPPAVLNLLRKMYGIDQRR